MTVREIMHVGEALPLASLDSPMTEILCIMTGKGFGCVGIMEKGILVGIITDGDLRRHMESEYLATQKNSPFAEFWPQYGYQIAKSSDTGIVYVKKIPSNTISHAHLTILHDESFHS